MAVQHLSRLVKHHLDLNKGRVEEREKKKSTTSVVASRLIVAPAQLRRNSERLLTTMTSGAKAEWFISHLLSHLPPLAL